MKGFIEVTTKDESIPVLLPIKVIFGVYVDLDGLTFIETRYDEENGTTGFNTVESYKEVVEKIKNAI